MSQATDVFDYMVKFGAITAKQAELQLGCMRLASRIGDLKDFGIGIEKRMIPVFDRNGNVRRVAQYFLSDTGDAIVKMLEYQRTKGAAL